MSAPKIKFGAAGCVFARLMFFEKAGDVEQGHSHTYDHLTLLASGSLAVDVNGKRTVFKAPHIIGIRANTFHRLEALEPNTVAACVHAIRPKDNPEELLDVSMLPAGTDWAKQAVPFINKLAKREE